MLLAAAEQKVMENSGMHLLSNLSNHSYIWSKVKIPFVAVNEGHTDQILKRLGTDSPLTCSFRRRGEERESKREKSVEDKYDNFVAFLGIFAIWCYICRALCTQQSSAMQKILQPASIFLLDRAHWLHCVSHKTREFSKQWNSFQRNFFEPSLHSKPLDVPSKISTKKISPEYELISVLPISWKLLDIPGGSSIVQNTIPLLLQTK